MNWLAFGFVAFVGIVSQTVLARRLGLFGSPPDWMFVLVVFFGLYSTRRDAVIAGWLLGLLVDLASVEPMGVHSVGFVLVALAVNGVRHLVFLKNAVTHVMVTFVAGLGLHALMTTYHVLVNGQGNGWAHSFSERSLSIVQSAGWALILHGMLLKFTSVLGLATSSYSHSGLTRAEAQRV